MPFPMSGSMRVTTTLSLSLWVNGRDCGRDVTVEPVEAQMKYSI